MCHGEYLFKFTRNTIVERSCEDRPVYIFICIFMKMEGKIIMKKNSPYKYCMRRQVAKPFVRYPISVYERYAVSVYTTRLQHDIIIF